MTLIFRLWNGMSERTRRDYPRPKFEKRVKELTAYKGWLCVCIGGRTLDELYLLTKINSGDGNVDLTPVIEDYKDALFSWWPLTRYQPMERYWKMRSLITTHLPSAFSDWFYIHRHQ